MSQKRVRKRRANSTPNSRHFICIVGSFACARNTRCTYVESQELCSREAGNKSFSVRISGVAQGVVRSCGNTKRLDSAC